MPSLAQNTMNQYNQAGQYANRSANLGFSGMSQAMTGYGQAGSMMPSDVQARQLSNTSLSPYMNPYQQQVTDATMGEMNRQEKLQDNNIQDAAQRAGAFGGDRMAIQQAENNRNFDMTRGATLANMNQANFGQAQNAAAGDIGRDLTAQQGNQTMRSGMSQFGLGGLGNLGNQQSQFGQTQMGNLSQQGFDMGQSLENRQMQMGDRQQNQNQDILNAIKGATQGWSGYGDVGLNRYFGATQSPGSYGTQTSQTNPGLLGTVGGWANIFGSLFSDRRLKKNVVHIGETIINDRPLNVYEYNYLWEDDSEPRSTGVMAQELMTIKPEAVVQRPDGYLAVYYSMI